MKRLLLILVLALLVTACGPSQPKEKPLYQGAEGVAVSFPRENSRTLYAQDEFTMSVRMENKGAADTRGWVTTVFDPAVYTFQQAKIASSQNTYVSAIGLPMPFAVKGRAQYVNVGEVEYADFTFKANKVPGNREKAASAITFQACYPYVTVFMDEICIDRDVYNTQMTKVCVERALSGSNQGAPIAVTRVEPSFLFNEGTIKPRFKITLSNLQNGYTLWSADTKADEGKALCNQASFDRAEFGKIKVIASINNVFLECGSGSNKDVTRFDGKTAEILCTYPAPSATVREIQPGANYEAPMVIQAQYFYVSSLTAELEVTNV